MLTASMIGVNANPDTRVMDTPVTQRYLLVQVGAKTAVEYRLTIWPSASTVAVYASKASLNRVRGCVPNAFPVIVMLTRHAYQLPNMVVFIPANVNMDTVAMG